MARKSIEKTRDWSLFVLTAVLLLGGWAIFALASRAKGIEESARFGILSSALATLSTVSVLAYWWGQYRKQGLKERPRISFREIYVLYFGMSVEVGLIVGSMIGPTDVGRDLFSVLLPPFLIAVIALMDDTPNARELERARVVRARTKPAQLSNRPPEGPGSSHRRHKKRMKIMARVRVESQLPPEIPNERGSERRAVAARAKMTQRRTQTNYTQFGATMRKGGWLIMNTFAPVGAACGLGLPAMAHKKSIQRRNPYEARLTPIPASTFRQSQAVIWNEISRVSTALLNTATMAIVSRKRPRCASTGA